MSWDKIQFLVSLLSLICLVISYWYVSKKDRISYVDKGVVTFLSVLILALSDKLKMVLWLAVVVIVWLIKYKNKKDELA